MTKKQKEIIEKNQIKCRKCFSQACITCPMCKYNFCYYCVRFFNFPCKDCNFLTQCYSCLKWFKKWGYDDLACDKCFKKIKEKIDNDKNM